MRRAVNIEESRILIVEDNPVAGEMCAYILANGGCGQVSLTADGRNVGALHAAEQFDLILLDLVMPDYSGFDVLAELMSLQNAPSPAVIVVSADSAQRVAALRHGALDFIAKPFDPEELLTRARNVLQLHVLQNQLREQVAQVSRASERLQLYRSATDNSLDGIFIVDEVTGLFIDVNQTACRMLGYSEEALMAAPALTVGILPLAAEHNGHTRDLSRKVQSHVTLVRADGSKIEVELGYEALTISDHRFAAITARDMQLRSESEQRLRQLADFDTLTGLANRRQFYSALEQTLSYARQAGMTAAVMFIDLDRFKIINDNLGHALGDLLLRECGGRLTRCVRTRDMVCRLGGDEFAVLMLLSSHGDAMLVAAKVRESFSEPFVLRGHSLNVSASIGVALYPDDTGDREELLQYADIAMYQAKASGRNTFRFFTPAMNAMGLERLDLESALRKAIEREEFCLHYQPKIDARSGRVSGVEALLRWNRPGAGLVSPAAFIPILEETGLIVSVGAWVIETACAQVRRWIDEGVGPVHVAVNVSARQFFDVALCDSIKHALERSGIDAGLLELELTESALMSNVDDTIASLNMIKALGSRIAIDDFGTGYSSLAYLKRFPIDTIKIDIAFVREVISNPPDAAITLAIIQMAHGLGLRAIAEGVETNAQVNFLGKHMCDELQGFFFSPALTAEATGRFILGRGERTLALPMVTQPSILLVDDDPDLLFITEVAISGWGYQVFSASSAATAFDVLASHRVDVILCDQRMPLMDGTEFFRRVKDLYPTALRIAMSGNADQQSITAAVNEGAIFKFLSKPWRHEELEHLLGDAFSLVAQRRERNFVC